MSFDTAILRELAVAIDVTGYLRIMEARFREAPTGTGHGESRFSSPSDSFTVLYAAQDLPTALAERVIRDRFAHRAVSIARAEPKGILRVEVSRQGARLASRLDRQSSGLQRTRASQHRGR